MGYNFTAQWIKGALNSAPDALSRHPVSDPLPLDLHAERDPGNEPEVILLLTFVPCLVHRRAYAFMSSVDMQKRIVVSNNFAITSWLGSLSIA